MAETIHSAIQKELHRLLATDIEVAKRFVVDDPFVREQDYIRNEQVFEASD